MKFKKSFVFSLILSVIIVVVISIYLKSVPVIQSFCESKARYIALDATNKAVIENIDGIRYEDLIKVERDENNKITSINANTIKLNKIATQISIDVKERISNLPNTEVSVPLTSMLNIKLLSGIGPNFKFKLMPSGNVTTVFKSEFEHTGINQTRHRIYIEVKTSVSFLYPISINSQEFINEIDVAETVLVGDIPETYYSINGMKELSENDAIEFLP